MLWIGFKSTINRLNLGKSNKPFIEVDILDLPSFLLFVMIGLQRINLKKQMLDQEQEIDGENPMPSEQKGSSRGVKIAVVVSVLLVLGTAGTAGYFYKQLDDIKKNPNKVALDESKATIEAVGKLIVLPEGEQPTIATVTDPSKLQDQKFFVNAKNGDKVLIYTTAKKAILYSPSTNKIVEVAPLNIGGNAPDSAVSGSATETPTK